MCEGLGPGESLDLVTRMSGEYSAVRLGELNDGQVMLDLVSIFGCSFEDNRNP